MAFEEIPSDPSLADPLPDEPLALLGRWLEEARNGRVQPNPTAMALATAGEDGRPSLRSVLCRGFDAEAGFLVFYTNRRSRKGRELAARPRAAAHFHWDTLERQVRLEGPVGLSPDAESDAYFASRPRPAQIAAWSSEQSEPVESRAALLEQIAVSEARFGGFGGEGEAPVPRPPHWGGYRLYPERIELWVGSKGRAHDRALWERKLEARGDGWAGGPWSVKRLQP